MDFPERLVHLREARVQRLEIGRQLRGPGEPGLRTLPAPPEPHPRGDEKPVDRIGGPGIPDRRPPRDARRRRGASRPGTTSCASSGLRPRRLRVDRSRGPGRSGGTRGRARRRRDPRGRELRARTFPPPANARPWRRLRPTSGSVSIARRRAGWSRAGCFRAVWEWRAPPLDGNVDALERHVVEGKGDCLRSVGGVGAKLQSKAKRSIPPEAPETELRARRIVLRAHPHLRGPRHREEKVENSVLLGHDPGRDRRPEDWRPVPAPRVGVHEPALWHRHHRPRGSGADEPVERGEIFPFRSEIIDHVEGRPVECEEGHELRLAGFPTGEGRGGNEACDRTDLGSPGHASVVIPHSDERALDRLRLGNSFRTESSGRRWRGPSCIYSCFSMERGSSTARRAGRESRSPRCSREARRAVAPARVPKSKGATP